MTRAQPARFRHALALVGAFALLLALLPVAFAGAQEQRQTPRQAAGVAALNANDNIGSAIAWSDFAFETSQQAILGRHDLFADNLASGTLQRLQESGLPLLLTESNQLSAQTRQELQQLGVQAVHVLGGSEAIAPAVTDELQQLGIQVHRHAGATRVETAIDIARAHFSQATTAILARASAEADPTAAFADSLAAGAWGAATGFPILLTPTGELPDTLRDFLQQSALDEIFVVGGTEAVSDNVVQELQQLGIEVVRVAGQTRFGTAVEIAEQRGFPDASAAPNVVVVPGVDDNAWASGFPAAAWSALNNAPIVLAAQAEIPEATQQWLEPGGPNIFLVCPPFVAQQACTRAAAMVDKPVIELDTTEVSPGGQVTGRIEGDFERLVVNGCGFTEQDVQVDQNGSFSLTLGQDVEETCELTFTVTDADGNQLEVTFQVTVEGGDATQQAFIVAPQQPRTFATGELADFSVTRFDQQPFTGPLDVALFPCRNVAATASVKTFADADNDNVADDIATTDTTNAVITTLNAEDIEDTKFVAAAQPGADNTLRFDVTSNAADCAVPVVFTDANDNDQLDLAEDDTPAEPFGLGQVTFEAP